MKFADLSIGDWFTDNAKVYCKEAVFIKQNDKGGYSMNWNSDVFCEFEEEQDVDYCSKFCVTYGETAGHEFEKKPFDFDSFEKTEFTDEDTFANIPVNVIYKGRGQTYYKKIGDKESIVIWSPKQETLGKIFETTDWETHKGHYYICRSAIFECLEEEMHFPNYHNP